MTTENMLQEIQEAILKKVNSQEYKLYHDFIAKWNKSIVADNRYKLALNKPISLARVLSALGNEYWYKKWMLHQQLEDEDWIYDQNIAIRKLLTDFWSDAMLSDQSPETIKAIWEIVCK